MLKIRILLLLAFTLIFAGGCYIDEPETTRMPYPSTYQPYSTRTAQKDYSYQKQQSQTRVYGGNTLNGRVIIVDPGHGGKDPGAMANGVREKDVNLNIGRKVASKLQDKGARAILTRNSDIFITLDNRAAAAEKYKADLLVSIHADSNGKKHISGATVLTGSLASQNSKLAARSIQSAIGSANIQYRPTRSQKLRVCDGHSRPAVLVEAGFLTNYQEAQNLSNSWYQDKIAEAIVNGIENYFSR